MNKTVYTGPAATSLSLFISLPEGKCTHSYILLPYPAHSRCSNSTSYIVSVVPTDGSKSLPSCEILGSEESSTLACSAVLDQWSKLSLLSSDGKRLSRTKLMITQDCDVSGQSGLLWGPIFGKALHSRGLRSKDGGISNSAYVKLNIPHVT